MSEMIERVAEAIALAGNGGTWDDWYNPAQKEFHRKRARAAIAAIEAMRVMTDGMLNAGDEAIVYDSDDASGAWFIRDADVERIWRAAIDAALKGEG